MVETIGWRKITGPTKEQRDTLNDDEHGWVKGAGGTMLQHSHDDAESSSACRPHRPTPSPSLLARLASVSWSSMLLITLVAVILNPVQAVYLPNQTWDNCLSQSIQSGNPLPLQFDPLAVWVTFNNTGPIYNLNVSIYGNVSGRATDCNVPPPESSAWSNPNETCGKIPDINPIQSSPGKNPESTLWITVNVLSYTPYDAGPLKLCDSIINPNAQNQNESCPVAPVFLPAK